MGFYWRMLLQPSDKYGAPRVEAARLRVSLTHIPTVMQPSDVRSDLAARILPDRNVRPIYMSPCPPFSMTCDFEVEHLGIGISSHWTYSSHIKSLPKDMLLPSEAGLLSCAFDLSLLGLQLGKQVRMRSNRTSPIGTTPKVHTVVLSIEK